MKEINRRAEKSRSGMRMSSKQAVTKPELSKAADKPLEATDTESESGLNAEPMPDYLGHRERLRERFRKAGAEGFHDYEILELLLTYTIPRIDVKPLAKKLIAHFGSLSGVLDAAPQEIEEVAKRSPEKILKVAIDPLTGLLPFQARKLAFSLGLQGDTVGAFVRFATGLYNAYMATDASLAEVNPLVVTVAGEVIALDAKMNFDDNALYRHPEVAALRDPDEEDPKETEAKRFDLSYIALDGDIGCMVNGAGLAMATMDIIQLSGGKPANFLDVGGGADEEKVAAAFKILLSDPKVKAVLVNIFGGIMKCDVIANGILAAARQVGLTMPLVVRLEGTNVELGKEILAHSDLEITAADDLGDAARKAVAAVRASR